MLDPLDFENRPYLDSLSRSRRWAFLSRLTELFFVHYWRPISWVFFFSSLYLFEVPQFIGTAGKVFALVIFIFVLGYLVWKDCLKFSLPSLHDVDKTLECSSKMPAGQISAVDDRLANPNKLQTREMWVSFQKQILGTFLQLRAPRPRALLARKDPYALRFMAFLFFIVGLWFAGDDWHRRLTNGLIPIPAFSNASALPQAANLWIKAPDYTGIGQIHLTGSSPDGAIVGIPEGSEIKVRFKAHLDWLFPPRIQIGKNDVTMTDFGNGLYGLESKIGDGETIRITQAFLTRASWAYSLVQDSPPEIRIDQQEPLPILQEEMIEQQPQASRPGLFQPVESMVEYLPNGHIRFPLVVKDDYGVVDLRVQMHLDDAIIEKPIGEDFHDTRLVMSAPKADFKISPVYDLTWHSWAGLPVTFTFEATDAKGQIATLEPIRTTVPERQFEHPVAKSLIAERKDLAWNYTHDLVDIARNIETLLIAPDFFNHNPVIFMAIRSASYRTFFANSIPAEHRVPTIASVIALLWDTAIAVEDGNLSLALRNLRNAQSELEKALQNPDADEKEIARLADDLRARMQEYFSELAREMQKRAARGEPLPQIPTDQLQFNITPESFNVFLDKLESEMRSGNKKSAQEMLSQLQRMMDMMDPSMAGQMPKDMQMMADAINELQELIDRQEKLLVQTQDQARFKEQVDKRNARRHAPQTLKDDLETLKSLGLDNIPRPPQLPQDNPDAIFDTTQNRMDQAALRYILGQLMMESAEEIDDIPENMGKAEQEMRGSELALGQNNPHQSIPHQEKALTYLKESQKSMQQQLQQRMQQMVGIGFSGGSQGQRYDPLGRPYGGEDQKNGNLHGSPVQIPDEAEKKRVDEILKILRQRSGEFHRPRDELEYYRRLLQQF